MVLGGVSWVVDPDFRALYDAAYPRLVRALAVACGDRGAAEDAVQEAFVRLVPRWERVRDYQDPEGWLRTVALRRLSNRERGARALARTLSPREDVANTYEARLEPDGQTLGLTYIEGCGPGLRWDVADNAGEVLARPVVLPPPVGTGCADIAITAESRTRLPTPAGERPVRVVAPGGQEVVPLDGRLLYAPQVPDGFVRELSYLPNPGGWTADTWRSRCGSFTLLQGPRALVTVEEDSGWEDAGTRDVNGFRATFHRYTSVSSLLGTIALSWTTPEGQVVLGGAGECVGDDELLAIALSLRLPED